MKLTPRHCPPLPLQETALMQGIFCLGVASFLGVLSGFLAIDKCVMKK